MDIRVVKHALKSFIELVKVKKIVPIQHPVDNKNMLSGKVALITGGSGGIGYAIAKSFLESGCKVIIAGTNELKLQKCVSELGIGARFVVLDINHVENISNQIDTAINLFGKIDILVNSAGVHSTKMMTNFFNITEKEYDYIIGVNLKGTYFVTQIISNYMIRNKIKGHILNISSSTGAEPAWSPYRLSKLGLEGLTKGLAQVLTKHNIIVNGIAPGSTATGLLGYTKGDSIYTSDNEIERYVMPDEIASYAKILVSELGDMVIGSTLYISGGRGTYDIR